MTCTIPDRTLLESAKAMVVNGICSDFDTSLEGALTRLTGIPFQGLKSMPFHFVRAGLISLTALAVSISASQPFWVKVRGVFEFHVSIHVIWMFIVFSGSTETPGPSLFFGSLSSPV